MLEFYFAGWVTGDKYTLLIRDHFKDTGRFKAEVTGSTTPGSRMMIVITATLWRLMLNIEISLKKDIKKKHQDGKEINLSAWSYSPE